MVVLALETVTTQGSVALLIGDACHARVGDPSRSHGERLPCELLALLDDYQVSLHGVDLLAVVAGPGSFTGLRVGMAAVQGLALAAGRRVAAIPTLEAMAEGWRVQQAPGRRSQAPEETFAPRAGDLETVRAGPGGPRPEAVTVIACLDGQRGDLFFAAWTMCLDDPIERATALIEPSVGSVDDLVRLVGERGVDPFTVLVELGPVRHLASLAARGWRVEEVSMPLAATAARMAARRADQATAPHALRPLYVRRPDAVLARERAGLLRQ